MEWRLFADLAERADTRRVTVDPGPEATVADALDALLETHPELEPRVLKDGNLAPHLTVLRDGEQVDDDLSVSAPPDVELALHPPVSGG